MNHLLNVVEVNPQILSGQPVFKGTRVPVSALFENILDGITIEGFVEIFPGVTLAQIRQVLGNELNYYKSHENFA